MGLNNIATDAELYFDLEREEKVAKISNLVGHVFIKSPYEKDKNIDIENSYMAFFKFDELYADKEYKPRKYTGFSKFEHFDAVYTTGQDHGMFGYLALEMTPKKKVIEAFYVFKAGDHMGGTVLFTCRAH
jgi:hypothetical protein